MKVKVKVYDGVKYRNASKKVAEVEYDIKGYKLVTGAEATQIGLETDATSRDEHNEYLLLFLKDGSTATFCNSRTILLK